MIFRTMGSMLGMLVALAGGHDYNAKLVRVIDGDTYDMEIDLGFKVAYEVRVRLLGIDVYETTLRAGQSDTEKLKGIEAKELAKSILGSADSLVISEGCQKTGKYGRLLCDVGVKTDGRWYSMKETMKAMGYERKEIMGKEE